jgi:cytochrome c biogenesis protein CcdA
VEHLLALVIGVGLVDSLNPTTLVPGLYLAAGKNPAKALGGFIAGFFATNLVAGVLVALGPGKYLLDLFPHPGTNAKHLIEITVGGVLIVLAGILWVKRHSVAKHVSNTDRLQRSSLVVGAGIAIVEFPTAIPYLAVIAAIVESGRGIPTQVVLLAIFNFCFLLPLFAILGLRVLAGERARGWLERMKAGVDRFLATLVPGIVLVAGLVLIGIGLYGMAGSNWRVR